MSFLRNTLRQFLARIMGSAKSRPAARDEVPARGPKITPEFYL